MKKNIVKVLSILLVAIVIISVSNVAFASVADLKEAIEKGSDTQDKAGEIGGMIVGILQVIGVAAAIIMLVFLGIKYVSAAPSEKADIKKSAAIYVVGAVMLLGATVILGWVETLVSDLGKEASVKPTEEYIHLA